MSATVNLVQNPSFEVDLTGWSFYNATATRVSNRSGNSQGDHACKMVAINSGAAMVAQYTVSGLTTGTNYTFSAYIKTQSVRTPFSVVPSAYGQYTPRNVTIDEAGYERRVMGFVALAATVTLRIFSESYNDAGDIMWIDKVALTKGGLYPYFDGSYPYSTWSGTANASTSSCTAFDSDIVGTITTDEVVVIDGFCLNTLAWNITSKTGRQTLPSVRGDDITVPSRSGKIFVPNKPVDAGLFTLSMFVLGTNPDGTIPAFPAMRRVWQTNFETILRQCLNNLRPVDIYTWQPDGSVRHAQGTAVGSSMPDPQMMVAGRRAEFNLVFEILSGTWEDYEDTVVVKTVVHDFTASPSVDIDLSAFAGGTLPIDDAIITVYGAPEGTIISPGIASPETGTSASLTGNVTTTQAWQVDMGNWTSIRGTFADTSGALTSTSSVLNSTFHSGNARFILLNPGTFNDTPHLTVEIQNSGSYTITVRVQGKRKYWVG